MAAVGVVAGMPNMAYPGARGAAVATSPLSVAVPAGRHELVLLDMATAVMALGRIAQLKAAGTELPPGVAVTADGEPTTDPAQATVPLPVGGAKGAGMSLVFELLASGLVANPIVPAYHAGSAAGRRHRQNGFPLAVDVSAFLPLDEFTATVDATVDASTHCRLATGRRKCWCRANAAAVRGRGLGRAAGGQGLARAERRRRSRRGRAHPAGWLADRLFVY